MYTTNYERAMPLYTRSCGTIEIPGNDINRERIQRDRNVYDHIEIPNSSGYNGSSKLTSRSLDREYDYAPVYQNQLNSGRYNNNYSRGTPLHSGHTLSPSYDSFQRAQYSCDDSISMNSAMVDKHISRVPINMRSDYPVSNNYSFGTDVDSAHVDMSYYNNRSYQQIPQFQQRPDPNIFSSSDMSEFYPPETPLSYSSEPFYDVRNPSHRRYSSTFIDNNTTYQDSSPCARTSHVPSECSQSGPYLGHHSQSSSFECNTSPCALSPWRAPSNRPRTGIHCFSGYDNDDDIRLSQRGNYSMARAIPSNCRSLRGACNMDVGGDTDPAGSESYSLMRCLSDAQLTVSTDTTRLRPFSSQCPRSYAVDGMSDSRRREAIGFSAGIDESPRYSVQETRPYSGLSSDECQSCMRSTKTCRRGQDRQTSVYSEFDGRSDAAVRGPRRAENDGICSDISDCVVDRTRISRESQRYRDVHEKRVVNRLEKVDSNVKNLEELLQNPFYNALWTSREVDDSGNGVLYIISSRDGNTPRSIEEMVRVCIHLKKQCLVNKARLLFLELIHAQPCLTHWLEFSRMEMETGEYVNAKLVLTASLRLFPDNLLLLGKAAKVAEKLREVDVLVVITNRLNAIESPKAAKSITEAVAMLGKLAQDVTVLNLVQGMITSPRFYTGWLFLDVIDLSECVMSFKHLIEVVSSVLSRLPKHGPLWSRCLDLLEHRCVIEACDDDENMNSLMISAIQYLSPDILWRIYLNLVLGHMRTGIIHTTRRINSDISFCDSVTRCMINCPSSFKWKVYSLLAKCAVVMGRRTTARRLLQRGLSVTPKKHMHYLIVDFAKTECFGGRYNTSLRLLQYGIGQFPDEWKLGLEGITQLIMQDRMIEALNLCSHVIRYHIGAGRLWTVYIHLIHELFGPDKALLYFRMALRHVAKSGEVWCEGARIYMDPSSSYFNVNNAMKALNFSFFFTPQYGDSYIEALRLFMISSDSFLLFHDCDDFGILSDCLCSSTTCLIFLKRAAFIKPNYGPLWFRCKELPLSSSKEILYHALYLTAFSIAKNSKLYYQALLRNSNNINYTLSNFQVSNVSIDTLSDEDPNQIYLSNALPSSNNNVTGDICHRRQFSYAFKTDMEYYQEINSFHLKQRIKPLFGSVPADN